jgi:signal transduction histidine kinase
MTSQNNFWIPRTRRLKIHLTRVNSLLDVSKIEEGKFGYDFQITPLLSFLDSVLVQAYDLGKQYNINVYFDRPKTDWRVRVDAQKLSMVFYNLLDNAIKYNVEHGSVTVGITLDSDNAHIVVSIRDTGIGIPSQQSF